MKERGPRLFIGPWVGEFGVEVLRWQAMARALASSRAWAEVIACSDPSREFLYRDFATRFVGFQAASAHALGFGCRGDDEDEFHRSFIDPEAGDVHFSPRLSNLHRQVIYGMAAARGEFRNFAENAPPPDARYDLLIHARATIKCDQGHKNWPVANWERLVAALPSTMRIASIGARTGAHKIRGTDDLRGLSLEDLAGHCGAARLVVGPSSGPIHYAMHCRLPAVTWVDRDPEHPSRMDARCNYYPAWNPWDVPLVCLYGWQPEPDLVAFKVEELLSLLESSALPVEYAVFGTKRSGHHGVLEWLTRLSPATSFTHWNDCVAQGFETFPQVEYAHPTRQMLPKTLHMAERFASVFHWNHKGKKHRLILSFEGTPIEKLALIPELKTAQKIVFVLRDGLNLAASLKQGIPELAGLRFLAPEFQAVMSTYRGYLLEAVGRTNWLGKLREKTVFVSYNRWHMDEEYRRAKAQEITGRWMDVPRGTVSGYAHPSGFQPRDTPAVELRTLARWKEFAYDDGFWNLACDPDLYEAENQFHGPYYLPGLRPPFASCDGLTVPEWAY